MFECDVKLSADDVPYLLHDDTLDRTTNASGTGFTYSQHKDGLLAIDQCWDSLSQLDAGSWCVSQGTDGAPSMFAGEPLPPLATISAWCIENDVDINIEIKPCVGVERHTGDVVARYAARLWQHATKKPLLTSFSPGRLLCLPNISVVSR